MPIKPPNSPDYHCQSCGHLFRKSWWRRLFVLMGMVRRALFPPCPKCGSKDVGRLLY